ncbi:MAG: SpaA isopeptide-forming pilin-related protein, partial [Vagococcus sp.]
ELIATEASHVYYNKDFKNENEREIDVSNLAGPDVYIRLAPEVLKLNTPLTIKGLEKNQGDGNFKNVYVIIETDSASSYNVQSQIKFKYTDGTERGNKETTDFSDNTLLWTFSYNNQPFSGDIYLGSTWLGSILAPLASLGGSQNIDGNIIVDHFKGAGETHGWNFQENKKGRVVLRKTSSIDGTKLAGAVFDLYQEGKEEPIKTDLTTDANGEIYVNDLKVGRYYFKETKAPDGYELSDKKIPFEITADTLKELTVVGVTNDKTPEEPEFYLGEVRVRKMDAIDTADRLKGAVFALYKVEDGKKDVLIDGNLTTNDKGEVVKTKLKEGSYYFQEVKAPDGYEKSDKKYPFEITKEFIKNKIDIFVDVPNKKIPELGSVVIVKTDQEDDSLFLAGAEFSLFKKDGTEIATGLTTNAEGKLTYKN